MNLKEQIKTTQANQGKLVVIEGPDGIGKSTTIEDLHNAFEHPENLNQKELATINSLKQRFNQIIFTAEPGATTLGKLLRNIILNSDTQISRQAKLNLFLADRAQHFAEIIQPALKNNDLIICDRFTISTLVYQTFYNPIILDNLTYNDDLLNELEKQWSFLIQQNQNILGKIVPDLTLYFTGDIQTIFTRINARKQKDKNDLDILEQNKLKQLLNKYAYVRRYLQDRSNSRHVTKDLIDINANQERPARLNEVIEGLADL